MISQIQGNLYLHGVLEDRFGVKGSWLVLNLKPTNLDQKDGSGDVYFHAALSCVFVSALISQNSDKSCCVMCLFERFCKFL